MTDTPAHTPLRLGMENGRNVSIIYQGDDAICSVYGIALHRSLDELTGRDAAGLAWGQFIVRACNSHYQLVEAAKAIMPRNLNLADWLPDDATIPLDVPVSELRALAAALSQAGGAGE